MKILRNFEVPTGNILIVEGEKGKLECLSLGDYGKDVNIKARFLGLSKDPKQVKHTDLLPLEKKWVITISTQYGCSQKCTFCDVPKVGPGKNASVQDMVNQVRVAMALHPEVTSGERLNIHFARMGEPTYNDAVLRAAYVLAGTPHFLVHSVVSTMMPLRNKHLKSFLEKWVHYKNVYAEGNAGLQLSINSTNEDERQYMFGGCSHTLAGCAEIMRGFKPVGRKFTLNFAVADYEIDPEVLLQYFSPEDYLVKLTPMHKTASCVKTGIKTSGDYTSYYPYAAHEEKLTTAGYDTLVFIASDHEDVSRITCGNAILSGTRPSVL